MSKCLGITRHKYIINWEYFRDNFEWYKNHLENIQLIDFAYTDSEREHGSLSRKYHFEKHNVNLGDCCLGVVLCDDRVDNKYNGITEEMSKVLGWHNYWLEWNKEVID